MNPVTDNNFIFFPTVVFVAKLNPALFPNAQTFQIPLKNRRRRHPVTQNVRRQQIGIIAAQKGIQTGHLARCSGKQNPAPVFQISPHLAKRRPDFALNIFGTCQRHQSIGALRTHMAQTVMHVESRPVNHTAVSQHILGQNTENPAGRTA